MAAHVRVLQDQGPLFAGQGVELGGHGGLPLVLRGAEGRKRREALGVELRVALPSPLSKGVDESCQV